MASIIDYFTQGSRIFFTSWKNRFFPKKYQGDANEICQRILKDCWNGRFFQTSTDNFRQFWTRDFGWCAQSLVKLGYQKEVQQTIRYALNRFKKYNKITTTITPGGKPFDFPNLAVDSLPWLIHSIRISNFEYYSHKTFLNNQIKLFFGKVVNNHTGLVKPDKSFSSIKDFASRRSSCYDNSMIALLAKDLQKLKLFNPFKEYNYPELLKRHFWSGKYFYDDLRRKDYISGDANVFPFLFGLYNDKEMLKSTVESMQEAKLDQPFPLKYTFSREKVNFIWQEIFLRNYESDAIWTHMGPFYIKLLKQVDKKKALALKKKYKEQIERNRNYLEVFTSKGKPYGTPFYYTDRGMLWAANYLTL